MVEVSTDTSTYVHRYTCVRVENKYKRGRAEGEERKKEKERETEKEYPSVHRKCTGVLCSPRAIHLVSSPDIVKPSCNIKCDPRLNENNSHAKLEF